MFILYNFFPIVLFHNFFLDPTVPSVYGLNLNCESKPVLNPYRDES